MLLLIGLLLSGCNPDNYMELRGESNSWTGKYSATTGNSNEDGKYSFSFKKGYSSTNFKQLQIEIDDGEVRLDDSDHKGVYIEIPSSCRECFSKEKESIKVAIK
ncbi:hypothetical protein AC739_00125 [Planococcus glaciei]|uniref:hypothetical protein n=1 Tax=Planococcus glaciei TaxID=459472 RepID=UPI00069EAECC|nr:hypothetical protein [Planococcus glaciei]KOF11961.1 hypothetical protein AC739_00125 [Planococcus glaciei]